MATFCGMAYTWDANKNKTSETITGVMNGYEFTSGGTTYDFEDRLRGYASYIDEPVVRKTAGTGGTLVYFHRNQQYSVTAITTSTGTIAERYAYTAYGQPTILDASGTVLPTSNFSLRYSFTGREWDATLGLYHFRARCMSPMTGRFLSRDPIGYADGFSLYSAMFAFQQMDPTGHVSVAKCGASDTVPYIDTVDMVNDEPVVDNKEVIGSITARGWVELGSGFSFPPKKCGDFVVQLDAHHTKKFNPLNAMEVQQQDSTTSTCSHSSSATEKSIHAEWRCPIACKNFKYESYTFASIFFLTQGKGPGRIYYTRPGQMIAIEATVDFTGNCCTFGCVVELKVCQLSGFGVPNNHTDPNPRIMPNLSAFAMGACQRWSAPKR